MSADKNALRGHKSGDEAGKRFKSGSEDSDSPELDAEDEVSGATERMLRTRCTCKDGRQARKQTNKSHCYRDESSRPDG